jgi:hypothetical protein
MSDTIGTRQSKLLDCTGLTSNNVSINRFKSLCILVKAISKLKGVDIAHKKHFIRKAIMMATETNGKWHTRYISKTVYLNAKHNKQLNTKIQHEHVIPRINLTEEIILNPNDSEAFMKNALGCIVSVDEHHKLKEGLNSGEDVWQRYRKAKIQVVDKLTGKNVW